MRAQNPKSLIEVSEPSDILTNAGDVPRRTGMPARTRPWSKPSEQTSASRSSPASRALGRQQNACEPSRIPIGCGSSRCCWPAATRLANWPKPARSPATWLPSISGSCSGAGFWTCPKMADASTTPSPSLTSPASWPASRRGLAAQRPPAGARLHSDECSASPTTTSYLSYCTDLSTLFS